MCAAAALAQLTPGGKIDAALESQLRQGPAGFFVVMKDRGLLQAASRIPERAARAQAVVQTLMTTAEKSQVSVRAMLRAKGVDFSPFWITNAVYVPNGDLALATALAQRSDVESIRREPVMFIPPITTATGTAAATTQWNLAKIRADQAWAQTRGAGIVVASIDTGARYTHQALVNQYRGNTGGGFSHTGNWKDVAGRCAGGAPCDSYDHGTHVLGIMVGNDGGTNQIGVAPEAKWIACKGCVNSSACYGSHLMACAQWVMDPYEAGTGEGRADVVNNSWSGQGATPGSWASWTHGAPRAFSPRSRPVIPGRRAARSVLPPTTRERSPRARRTPTMRPRGSLPADRPRSPGSSRISPLPA